MSLKVEIYAWDYQLAVKVVQKLLDAIGTDSNGAEVGITNLPSAEEIVDAVWDAIR